MPGRLGGGGKVDTSGKVFIFFSFFLNRGGGVTCFKLMTGIFFGGGHRCPMTLLEIFS